MDFEQTKAELEKRYRSENELMKAVASGNLQAASALIGGAKEHTEKRSGSPLNDIKNYTVILNTLLRKAAEEGGVHPVHLHRLSSGFAKQIESLTAVETGYRLQKIMVEEYCLAVSELRLHGYSSIVQRALTLIDHDLSAHLSLKDIAKAISINPSHLSYSFKKETGMTLTQYVTERRIKKAKELLKNRSLQIQAVAQECGYYDVNYFSKVFKKETALTPTQFRDKAE